MTARVFRFAVLTWLTCMSWALGHEIRPAYLQIDETAPGSYEVLWKVPSRGDTVLDIQPRFDSGLVLSPAGEDLLLDGFVVYRYRLSGGGSLAGTRLLIDGLKQTTVDVLVRLTLLDGGEQTLLLQPKTSEATIASTPSGWQVAQTYVTLGVEHILFGFDHLLFVLALIILTKGFRRIVKTITAFTLAHSITLSLATLGFVHVPGPPVEATIALSILFLASEILRSFNGESTLTARRPWLVAFVFGLLHGLGFAGALSEIGLPQAAIPLALACFNIGVELGQLAFVVAALLVFRLSIHLLDLTPDWLLSTRKVLPYAIGAVSAFWVIERVWAFTA